MAETRIGYARSAGSRRGVAPAGSGNLSDEAMRGPVSRVASHELERRGVKLALGINVYDPADPMGKMFFNILATFAEFEADLIRMRTREGMAVARAKGKLKGKTPKLSERRQTELRRMYDAGDYSISDLAEVFDVSRPTVYRVLKRMPTKETSSTRKEQMDR